MRRGGLLLRQHSMRPKSPLARLTLKRKQHARTKRGQQARWHARRVEYARAALHGAARVPSHLSTARWYARAASSSLSSDARYFWVLHKFCKRGDAKAAETQAARKDAMAYSTCSLCPAPALRACLQGLQVSSAAASCLRSRCGQMFGVCPPVAQTVCYMEVQHKPGSTTAPER